MNYANKFEELQIWQNAMELALKNYKLFKNEKLLHDFVIKNQMIRSSFSISNNIAEGFEFYSQKQFLRFLSYAKASASEYRNQLIFIYKLEKINKETFDALHTKTTILIKQIQKFVNTIR